MPEYFVTGSLHDRPPTEGEETLTSTDRERLALLQVLRPALEAFAANVSGLDTIPDVVAQVSAAASGAQAAAARAAASAAAVEARENLASTSALIARDWAIKEPDPVEGSDFSAKVHAGEARDAAGDIDDLRASVDAAATEARAAALTAGRYANDLPGAEVAPGLFSARHYLDAAQRMLATGASLQEWGRITGGTDNSTEVVNTVPAMFFKTVRVAKADTRVTRFKCQGGQWTQPPTGANTGTYAWIHLIQENDGAVHVEGPADPGGGSETTTLKPQLIAQATPVERSETQVVAAHLFTPAAVAIPAGANRKFVAHLASINHSSLSTPPALGLACPQATNIVERGIAGNGSQTQAEPIRIRLVTGDFPGSAALSAVFSLDVPNDNSCVMMRLKVYGNTGGFEDAFVLTRAGTAATITSPAGKLTPGDAGGTIDVFAAFKGSDAAPVALAPATNQAQAGFGARTNKDLSWANVHVPDAPAATQSFTATSAKLTQAVMSGIVVQPITATTTLPAGDDHLVHAGADPAKLAGKGAHGWLLAYSDGVTWLLDS